MVPNRGVFALGLCANNVRALGDRVGRHGTSQPVYLSKVANGFVCNLADDDCANRTANGTYYSWVARRQMPIGNAEHQTQTRVRGI
jgi:hypothetical protein